MRAELIEGRVEKASGFPCGHELAVDVEADAAGFVPRQGEMNPLVWLGDFRKLHGDARAAEIHVGDESVKAMAVPIDAEPNHVPAGVVGKSDAEYWELGFVEWIVRAPEERKRAALRIDVARRPVGEQLIVATLNVGTTDAVGKNFDVALVVRDGIAAGGIVSVEAVVA